MKDSERGAQGEEQPPGWQKNVMDSKEPTSALEKSGVQDDTDLLKAGKVYCTLPSLPLHKPPSSQPILSSLCLVPDFTQECFVSYTAHNLHKNGNRNLLSYGFAT